MDPYWYLAALIRLRFLRVRMFPTLTRGERFLRFRSFTPPRCFL